MEDWREVEAVWQEGLEFTGVDKKGEILAVSGSGKGFSPMELLLIGLAGCTGIDVASILQKKRQPLVGLKVKVRGLRRASAPRIYTHIQVNYMLVGEGIDPKAVEQAIRLSEEKYCSASIMLGQSAKISSNFQILEKSED